MKELLKTVGRVLKVILAGFSIPFIMVFVLIGYHKIFVFLFGDLEVLNNPFLILLFLLGAFALFALIVSKITGEKL